MDIKELMKVEIPTKKERGIKRMQRKGLDAETGELVIFNGLTEAQEYYCKLRAEGFSQTQSYKRAYPKDTHPAQNAYHMEQKPSIQERIGHLRKERASAAKLISPEESLARWNFMYITCAQNNDIKGMMDAQRQIDKINGADTAAVQNIIESKQIFRGEADEWRDTAAKLLQILVPNSIPNGNIISPEAIEVPQVLNEDEDTNEFEESNEFDESDDDEFDIAPLIM